MTNAVIAAQIPIIMNTPYITFVVLDTAHARRLFIPADCKDVSAKDRLRHDDGAHDHNGDHNQTGTGISREIALPDLLCTIPVSTRQACCSRTGSRFPQKSTYSQG